MRWWEAGLPGNDRDAVPTEDQQADDGRRSILRDLLSATMAPADVDRLEVSPGQWYLPGTPP